MQKKMIIKIVIYVCTLALAWNLIEDGFFSINFLDGSEFENGSYQLHYLGIFRNDFVNIVAFLIFLLIIEFVDRKSQTKNAKTWVTSLIELARTVFAMTLAAVTVSYWNIVCSYIWHWKTYRLHSNLVSAFTLIFMMASAFLLISFDPITPLLEERVSGKFIWQGVKARLISFFIVYLLLSVRMPISFDEYSILLPVWLVANIVIWVSYVRYLKKSRTKENSDMQRTV
jgi:hypothetical protein